MAKGYDPKRLVLVLEELLEKNNESYREASLKAGLDHGSMRRYLRDGTRPSINSLLLLADHFEVNPNELLVLAGYQAMKIFEREPADLDKLTPDVRRLAEDLERIGDPTLRWRLAAALRLLIAGYLEDPD